ncbi:MAG: response regulator transcription factor [Chloroflexi bacterium]|nr:response regulator transcription factor [Chloroflexota bacterium]
MRVLDMVKVLLAEDHKIVRQGTRLYLEQQGVAVVGEATNGREAVEMALSLQPDVVIMDIHLPELTGIEATRRIRHDSPEIRVLVLTAYDEPAYVHALLDAGADGFILKTAELSDLIEALHEVAGGRQAFDAKTLTRVEHHMREMTARIDGLTERELEVLTQVAQGKTNKEIGSMLFISDRTVQGHLKNIYDKLGVTTRTEAVTVALQHGFIRLGAGGSS